MFKSSVGVLMQCQQHACMQPAAKITGHFAASPPAAACLLMRQNKRPSAIQCSAAKQRKGFGNSNKTLSSSDDEEDGPKQRKMKRRNIKTTLQEQQQASRNQVFENAVMKQQEVEDKGLDEEFTKRLQQLKREGEMKKVASSSGTGVSSQTPVAGTAGKQQQAPVAAFDAKPEDIYANPPSVADTLLGQLNSDVSDPALKSAQFGPNQIAVAGGAIIFGLVFVLVSGGDFAPSNRFQGVRPAQEVPDSVEQGLLKGAITQLEQDLAEDPNDIGATEQMALAYARLQQFDKASQILEKLVARVPNDADAWRLLGETNLLSERSQPAVAAYKRAVQLRDNDMQIATGLVDAFIANGQQANAVEYLLKLRARAPPVSAWGVRATDAPDPSNSNSSSEGSVGQSKSDADSNSLSSETAASTSDAATSSSSSSSSSRRPIRPLEPVSVELLLAKTYSAWRGHDTDALATYDDLIKRFPEDFRGYLAKGVFLRDKGRRADAERMFLQARFYAPENRQMFVKETAETKPIVDLPGSD
ncbi:hypothetical protein DUNSADRAFT_16611 [Dunaliella salina]|uniref:Uncharacterized protein n=1 Tax=Dunaliella salina TaxID=3046 RepID=A0ABQ7G3A5_DUNSA|nr:hypothetical protein DUNSADRAFT_16611 [Dunaliella salina]|eukprot:KAF5829078.1 hypothetical protein DUNSADRAFT_16611 [Dunaliella salina]